MSLLDHQELSIVKGIGATPGDTASAEQPLIVVDLLTSGSAFALTDWTPNIPSLKSGGVWADSSISDGRTLIAGVNTNVTETMTVQLTGSTVADFASQFAKFQRMIQDARDFWDTFYQIEPVYIRWWANNAPGPQFALIYNIDMDVEWGDSNLAQATLTLTIEREYGWRAIAPGGNPKQWYYYSIGQRSQWNAANANLLAGADHILTATINNRAEQNSTASAYVSQNFVDIPANKIPGDLPALLCLGVAQTVLSTMTTLYVGKSTKPTSGNTSRNTGNNQMTVYTFNAGDGNSGTDTSLAADTGAPRGQNNVQNRSVTTFATATMLSRLSWPGVGTFPNGLSVAVQRGRYMAFVRARVSAAATCSIQLVYDIAAGSPVTNTPVTFSDLGTGGTGNTTAWGVVYLGLVTIPYMDRRTTVGGIGLGQWIDSTGGQVELSFGVWAARTSGAGSLYMSDLILIPIDEAAIKIASPTQVGSGGNNVYSWNYDNTGYFMHGSLGDFSTVQLYTPPTGANTEAYIPVLTGSPLMLTPNVANRLIFFMTIDSTNRSAVNEPSASTVRVDIVPRWSGIRDI